MSYLLKEETPAYRITAKGTESPSDVDLVSVLIATGETSPAASAALKLARRLLETANNNLHELGKISAVEMQQIGLTAAQANRLISALEIGRRRNLSDLRDRPRIATSRDAYNCIHTLLKDLHHEEFWVLLLNKACEVIGRKKMSTGGTSGTVADIKIIFKQAIESRASAIIAVHNHPSGNLKPSDADLDLTRKMKESGKILDLPLLDHLIISERGYYSFADEGVI